MRFSKIFVSVLVWVLLVYFDRVVFCCCSWGKDLSVLNYLIGNCFRECWAFLFFVGVLVCILGVFGSGGRWLGGFLKEIFLYGIFFSKVMLLKWK